MAPTFSKFNKPFFMGQIADDMIAGRCCALCGQYFSEKETNVNGADVPVTYEHGYPVACSDCWEKDCGYEKTKIPTI